MAFVSSGLLAVASLGIPSTRGGNVWYYTSSDPHATVEAANYFNGAGYGSRSTAAVGLLPGDIMIVRNFSTAGTSAVTLHAVSSISTSTSAGGFAPYNLAIHATISAAST